MIRYFGPKGFLAEKLLGFEFRKVQLEMAQAIYDSLRDGTHLLAEAGTGTGKTLAYLVPAILSGRQVVISTGTKTLQDQILDHDIPLLRRLLFPNLRAVCLKGRRNYLCLRRLREFVYQPSLWRQDELLLLRRIQDWAQRTKTGDRAEIAWLPDNVRIWNDLTASGTQCLGSQCDNFSSCFLMQLRQEASLAELVVVNHHLFFADLSLRNKGVVPILPDYDAVVFDEAHQLEDVVSINFSIKFSSSEFAEAIRSFLRLIPTAVRKPETLGAIHRLCNHLFLLLNGVLDFLRNHSLPRFRLTPPLVEHMQKSSDQLVHNVDQLGSLLLPCQGEFPVVENCFREIYELSQSYRQIAHSCSDDCVCWGEVHNNAMEFTLYETPIDIASVFRKQLIEQSTTVILTSATLSVPSGTNSSFEFIMRRLGFSEKALMRTFPSPFDFGKQVLVLVPSDMPSPHENGFCHRVMEISLQVILRTKGRALFLFTSYGNMKRVYEGIHSRLPYPVMIQGQGPKRKLLAEFRENIESVLFATYSFWEGIDVPGDSLSCVLIDKLPFEVPSDPIVEARMDKIAKGGGNPFYEYQVPRAIIQLKQGIGRLIRSSSDRGIIVLFDTRIYSKSYGKWFLQSLAPMPITRDMREIDRFLAGHG